MRMRTRTNRATTRAAEMKSRAVWDQGVFMGELVLRSERDARDVVTIA